MTGKCLIKTKKNRGGALASALYSVVVLDELNPLLNLGLLDEEEQEGKLVECEL